MHPIAFKFGPLTVHWYGVMVALAFLAGLWTASRRGMLEKVAPEKILDLGPWLIAGSILGARTFYVLTFWRDQFADKPLWEVLAVWKGGLVFYGGLVGASAAVALYARLKNFPLWKLADILAPSVALGYVFGRIGCLMNGCCYGRECHLPWAITFPVGHDTHPLDSPAMPVHPTEVYESLLSFILYLFLAWLFRRKKFDGQVFATYLVSYAFLRSFVEYFRGDYPLYQRFLGGLVTPAQAVSVAILAAGLALFWCLPRTQPDGGTRG